MIGLIVFTVPLVLIQISILHVTTWCSIKVRKGHLIVVDEAKYSHKTSVRVFHMDTYRVRLDRSRRCSLGTGTTECKDCSKVLTASHEHATMNRNAAAFCDEDGVCPIFIP